MIDSHCHLNYSYGNKTPDDLIREASLAGVTALVNVGTGPDSIKPCESISEKHACVFHTVGLHPHEARTMNPSDMDLLRKAATHPKCRGIGEIGLDFFYQHSNSQEQISCLKSQLQLALETRLPVIIHCRDAEKELLPLLLEHAQKRLPGQIPGVLHCFTSSLDFGKQCIQAGYYISFSGMITFKNSENLQLAVQTFPLDRLLVETDAPFLAPIPFRGKRCEPSMVTLTAQKIAELRNLPVTEVDRTTTENASRLFQLF